MHDDETGEIHPALLSIITALAKEQARRDHEAEMAANVLPVRSHASDDTVDRYLTLDEACERFFGGTIGPDSLRAEARRGRLHISRVGRTDFVSPAAIREMMAAPSPSGSASLVNKCGSLDAARVQSARAAALGAARALKKLPGPK